jgi:hypothetical protein
MLTKELIAFARVGETTLCDAVPLFEVKAVQMINKRTEDYHSRSRSFRQTVFSCGKEGLTSN